MCVFISQALQQHHQSAADERMRSTFMSNEAQRHRVCRNDFCL